MVDIPAAPISTTVKLRRFRAALAHAPDSAAHAARMQQLARLVAVHDAVLLSVVNDKIIVQTWREPEPGFSALRELGPRQTPLDLLTPLAPKNIVDPDPTPKPPPFHAPVAHWYERRTWQATVVLGIASAIVGGILIERAGNSSFPAPTHPQWDPGLGRR